jgi:hypothetical protein
VRNCRASKPLQEKRALSPGPLLEDGFARGCELLSRGQEVLLRSQEVGLEVGQLVGDGKARLPDRAGELVPRRAEAAEEAIDLLVAADTDEHPALSETSPESDASTRGGNPCTRLWTPRPARAYDRASATRGAGWRRGRLSLLRPVLRVCRARRGGPLTECVVYRYDLTFAFDEQRADEPRDGDEERRPWLPAVHARAATVGNQVER